MLAKLIKLKHQFNPGRLLSGLTPFQVLLYLVESIRVSSDSREDAGFIVVL